MRKRLWAVTIVGIILLVATMISSVVVVAQQTEPTLISIEGGTIAHGGALQSDIIGDTFPNGLAGFQIRVSTGDPSIAVAFDFSTPDYGLTMVTSTASSVTMAAVDLNGRVEVAAVDAVLGTMTFLGRSQGITPIVIDVLKMDDEGGLPILTSTAVGLLTVSNPRDLDGDGITEDINGNGLFDFADVVMLFHMLVSPP